MNKFYMERYVIALTLLCLNTCAHNNQDHIVIEDDFRDQYCYARLARGELDEAENAAIGMIRTGLSNAEAYDCLAQIQYKRGNIAEAIKNFQKAIGHPYGGGPLFYNNLAVALMEIRDYTNARDALLKAVELDPEYYEAYGNLGTCWVGLGETEKAIQALKMCLNIQPNNEECTHSLEQIQEWLRIQEDKKP